MRIEATMAARFAGKFRRYEPAARPFDALRTHLSLRPHQLSARHPQIAQREQHRQSRGVLGQPAIPDLGVAKLLFDEAEWVLDLGTDAGLELLRLLQQLMQLALGIKGAALARPHGDFPAHLAVLELLALVHALVARIAPGIGLLAMQQLAAAWVTSLTLAAVPTTVCTRPDSASTPMCAFIPKCH